MIDRKMLRAGFALTTTSLILGFAAPLRAQAIDYGEMEALFGEPVTTSATGAPQRASDVPAAMTIITGDELRRTGATNLAEALRGQAGIDVNRFGSQQYDVAVRGGNQPFNPRLLVMVNGRQIYLDHYGLTSWSNLGIELAEIRQIEIVKGPVSALFGFNAASGAINIVTYHPVADHVNGISAFAGNDGGRGASAVGTLHVGETFGVRISGGHVEQDEFATLGPATPEKPYRDNLALDASYEPSSKVTTRIGFSHAKSRQLMIAPTFFPIGMTFETNGGRAELSADTGIGLIGASVDYSELANDYDLSLAGARQGTFHTKLFVGHVQDLVKFGPHDTVRFTGEYRHNALTVAPDLAGEVAYRVYSGGLMWDHRFSSAITLNLAGRVDLLDLGQSGAVSPLTGLTPADFDQRFAAWSANAGLVVKPDAVSTLRFQAARGVQAPSLISLGVAIRAPYQPGVIVAFTGAPDLHPAITDSAEIGYARAIDAIDGKFTVNLFWSRTHNSAQLNQESPVFVPGAGVVIGAGFGSGGGFASYGLESVLKGRFSSRLGWQIDYVFDEVDNHFGPLVSFGNRPFEALTPRHKIAARLSYSAGPLSLDGRALLRSRVVQPINGASSGWTAGLDGRAGWRLAEAVELFAVGENLTGAKSIDNGYIRQDVRGRVGVSVGL